MLELMRIVLTSTNPSRNLAAARTRSTSPLMSRIS
jgi:hypothetical protein